jgi:phage terminase large subunit
MVVHRRAGKTVATLNDTVKRAVMDGKQDGRYAYIAPFYSQAKMVAWDYLLKYTEPIRTAANVSELSVDLINRSRVRLFGADNPDSLRGIYLDGATLDEVADMKPRIWGEVIRPLLADRGGWATFIGTPKGKNEFHRIWKNALSDPAWYTLLLKASQSGLVSADELAEVRKHITEDQYEQEFECSFEAAILGAFYGRDLVKLDQAGRITAECRHDPTLPVHTAWDLGFRDDTAIWWYQVVRNEIHVIDFHASSGQNIEFYAELIASRPYKYGRHWLPHDARAKTLASGGRSIIEQLAQHLDIKTLTIAPELSVQDGIQAVRMMLPRVWFHPDCEEGIEALRQYQREWDEDKNAFKERPRHDWTSHPADAFRMMAVAWQHEAPKPKAPEPMRGLAVGAGNNASLDELWKTVKRSSGRI